MLVEVEPPGSVCRSRQVRLETARRAGAWFPWAWLAADCVGQASTDAGLRLTRRWDDGGRSFAELVRS